MITSCQPHDTSTPFICVAYTCERICAKLFRVTFLAKRALRSVNKLSLGRQEMRKQVGPCSAQFVRIYKFIHPIKMINDRALTEITIN